MGYLILAGLLMAAVFGPQFWVRSVMARYAKDRPDLPGTGGELAEHLVDSLKLDGVKVERTDGGDHYDPQEKAVRLSAPVYDGRSLTAVAVATHEVGHAVQDAWDYTPLQARTRLVKWLAPLEKLGYAIMLLAPVVGLGTRAPGAFLANIAVGLLVLGSRAVIHAFTLPVEFDASFNRALPILDQGGYLAPEDMPAARRILTAAALTYVAAALMDMLNIARWFRVLRI